MSNVVDLGPALSRKRASQCKHPHADVDLTAASLTCRDCGAEIDPWWFLRKLATESDDELATRDRTRTEFNTWYEAARAQGNAQIAKLNADIAELYAEKNRLQNEYIAGVHLGASAAKQRRRRTSIRNKT